MLVVEQEEQEAVAYLTSQGVSLPLIEDTSGVVAAYYRVNSLPTVIVLDGKGGLMARHEGQTDLQDLEKLILATL